MTHPDPPQHEAPCGTRTAYHRHLRRDEPVDGPCSDANAQYAREWRARQKEKS